MLRLTVEAVREVLHNHFGGAVREETIEDIADEIVSETTDRTERHCVQNNDECVLSGANLAAGSAADEVAGYVFEAGIQPALKVVLALLERIRKASIQDPQTGLNIEWLAETVNGASGIENPPDIRKILEDALVECKGRCIDKVSGWDEFTELLTSPFRVYLALVVILDLLDEDGDFVSDEFDERVPPPTTEEKPSQAEESE